jgi:arsenite methyltransferase
MSMTQASSEYFERTAAEWDDIRSGYFTEAVRDAAIAKAYLRPEMVVADIGAGTGFMSAGLAPLVKRVHVIDGSAAMLAVAKRNLSRFDNLVYHEADGQSIPLPDKSLDVIFANMYLHHCPDPVGAIQEMVRLLRPGGRLMITDMDVHHYEWMKEEMADVWMGFERQQIRDWFQQAGLVNIIVDCSGQSCCAESLDSTMTSASDRSITISIFLATGTKQVSGVQQSVQSHYSALAKTSSSCNCSSTIKGMTQSSSCCGDSLQVVKTNINDHALMQGYTEEQLLSVPADASEISLGCGNPTALADLKAGQVVLDIGSGGGLDAFLAVQKVGATGKVIGVDMTPAMLERAGRAAAKAGLNNLDFRMGQAAALPVDDNSVDVALSNCVINLSEDKGKVFKEIYRVLKANGRMTISDIVTDRAFSPEKHIDTELWSECVAGALPEQEYIDLIAQAGFKNIVVKRSAQAMETDGVKVYSVIVSAEKALVECKCGQIKVGCCG